MRRELPEKSARHTGRGPKYLFSTLLKCGTCGTNYSLRGKSHYACGRHLDGRACSQTIGIKRKDVERALLEGIRNELLSPEAIDAAVKAAHRVLNTRPQAKTNRGQIDRLKAEIAHLTDAIASGALKSSPAIADRVARAERELPKLESAPESVSDVARVIPRIADEYRAWVDDLGTVLSPERLNRGWVSQRDIARARAALRKRLGGSIVVRETDKEIRLETEAGGAEIALGLAVAGSQEYLVAGARSALSFPGVTVPLLRPDEPGAEVQSL